MIKERNIKNAREIKIDDVVAFMSRASLEDCEWIMERKNYWIEQKGEKSYFPPFRNEFAKKFFPDLFQKVKGSDKIDLIYKRIRQEAEIKAQQRQ